MEFGWIIWVALLVAWTAIALLVAYLFGGWARRSEASAGVVVASKVRYLRRKKPANGVHRIPAETKPRYVAGGRARH